MSNDHSVCERREKVSALLFHNIEELLKKIIHYGYFSEYVH